MVHVGQKIETSRTAVAVGKIMLGSHTFSLVQSNQIKKGDVLSVAQIAGIMGAKQTSSLIPLCHPLVLDSVNVEVGLDQGQEAVGGGHGELHWENWGGDGGFDRRHCGPPHPLRHVQGRRQGYGHRGGQAR